MELRTGVNWSAPEASKILDGSYTLSAGITPSMVNLTTTPLEPASVPWGAPVDVALSDGNETVTVRDCRISQIHGQAAGSGTNWQIQLEDHRWRWLYGYIEGEHNVGVPDGGTPEQGTQQDQDKVSARDLAVELLDAMGENSYDVTALPDNQYPEAKWDYIRPAQALADLCDRYQLVICFDPNTFFVKACKRGEGSALNEGDSRTESLDAQQSSLKIPKTLVVVAERTEYEVSLELEAVGQEYSDTTAGGSTVKPIAELSYKPAAGWGNDLHGFGAVSATAVTDPDTGHLISKRELAKRCIYRWYRVTLPSGTLLPGESKQPTTLRDILPLSGKLVDTVQHYQTNALGSKRVLDRKPAYVYGQFWDSKRGAGVAENTTDGTIYPGSFTLEEETGLVKFSEPIFKWDGSSNIAAPTLSLRCVVLGKRYAKTDPVGGTFGEETLPVPGVVLQYKDAEVQNRAAVDVILGEVLSYRKKQYDASRAGTQVQAGIQLFALDGRIQQVTWSCGPSGSTTQVSASTEHDPTIPAYLTRRFFEKQGATAKWAGMEETGKGTGSVRYAGELPQGANQPKRWLPAYNTTGSTINGYSLVRVTAVDANGLHTIALPNADSQHGLFVTSASPILNGGYGMISRDWPLPAKYAGSAPAVGDFRGAASGSAQLTVNKGGFMVYGVDSANGLALVVAEVIFFLGLYALGSSNAPTAQVDAYVPPAQVWTARTRWATLSTGFNAAAASTGTKAYFTGGNAGNYICGEMYIDTWAARTNINRPHGEHGAGHIGAYVYCFGNGTGSGVNATTDRFDPAANSWAARTAQLPPEIAYPSPPPPTYYPGRYQITQASADMGSAIYTAGGVLGTLALSSDFSSYTEDAWTVLAALPVGRRLLGAFQIAGIYYACGGVTHASGWTTTAEVDGYNGAWFAGTAMPTARGQNSGAATDVAGFSVSDVETVEYDPVGLAWSTRTNALTSKSRSPFVAVSYA